jgi:hypothetical protein
MVGPADQVLLILASARMRRTQAINRRILSVDP